MPNIYLIVRVTNITAYLHGCQHSTLAWEAVVSARMVVACVCSVLAARWGGGRRLVHE